MSKLDNILDRMIATPLWENESPSSAFEEQSVTLSKPMTNYDVLAIKVANIGVVYVDSENSVAASITQSANRSYLFSRNIIKNNTENKISFGDCFQRQIGSTATVYNSVLIPLAIYGINNL